MRLSLIKLDVIATIAWLLMDLLWMWGMPGYALLMTPVVLIALIFAFRKTTSENTEKIIAVTVMWLGMNGCWIATDVVKEQFFIMILKLVGTVFCVGALVGLSYFMSKKTNDRRA